MSASLRNDAACDAVSATLHKARP